MPGLKSLPPALVDVRAPEQARFALGNPPMCTSAAFERWQPRIASPLAVSQYAVEPSASTFELDWLVLPAHRPASPEIAESPSATIDGGPTPGPSAHAAALTQHQPTATTQATRRRRTAPTSSSREPGGDPLTLARSQATGSSTRGSTRPSSGRAR